MSRNHRDYYDIPPEARMAAFITIVGMIILTIGATLFAGTAGSFIAFGASALIFGTSALVTLSIRKAIRDSKP